MFLASIKASLGIALLSCATTTLLSAKTTLTWIDYQINDKNFNDLIAQDFQEYSTLHPDIDFKRSVIPQGEFKSKLIQATATKTIPDLILLDNPDNQALAAQGTVADITDKVKAINGWLGRCRKISSRYPFWVERIWLWAMATTSRRHGSLSNG